MLKDIADAIGCSAAVAVNAVIHMPGSDFPEGSTPPAVQGDPSFPSFPSFPLHRFTVGVADLISTPPAEHGALAPLNAVASALVPFVPLPPLAPFSPLAPGAPWGPAGPVAPAGPGAPFLPFSCFRTLGLICFVEVITNLLAA